MKIPHPIWHNDPDLIVVALLTAIVLTILCWLFLGSRNALFFLDGLLVAQVVMYVLWRRQQ